MTIKDLKDLLSKYPDDQTIWVCGPDSGGYDWTYLHQAEITTEENSKDLFLWGVGDEHKSDF